MINGMKFIMFLMLIGCTTSRAGKPPVKPLVFALNLKALEDNRSRINAKDPAILSAYKLLLKDADKALISGPVSVMEKTTIPPSGDKHDYMSLAPYFWPDPSKPNGLPYMRKDGQTNPEVKDYKDKEYMPKLCGDVQTLALAYYFSGDKTYADHAAHLLKVWFLDTATRMNPNLNFGQAIKGVTTGRGAGMIDTRHFVKLIDAIGLLNGAKAWTNADQQGMQKWFSDFLNWMQTNKIGTDEMKAENNHGAWYDAQRLSMALFTGNNELAKSIALNAAERLDKQMDANGKFPKEMERTISLHYSVFVMEAFFNIANMAEKVGVNFWTLTTPSGKSLQKGFDVLKPYLTGEKTWEGPQIKPFETEEGYFLLLEAVNHFNCKSCPQDVKQLAGEKAARLKINLLY
jgi:hypothetical protein